MGDRQRVIIRIMVWGAACVFLLMLAFRDVQIDRTLVVDARMDRATPYLSTFGPPSRVALSSNGAALRAEPVYVNLRIPRWFRRANVEVTYENPGDTPFRLGVRTHPTAWAFHFPDPERPHPLSLPLPEEGGEKKKEFPHLPSGGGVRGGGTTTLRVPFILNRSWQVERNVYRFVLSAPGASAEQPIIIRGLRVTAERAPLCFVRWCF